MVPSHEVGREHRRIEEHEAAIVEKIAARLLDLAAHAQDGILLRRANPQMAQVVQKRDAMLLVRDRIVARGADDLETFRRQLIAAGRALVLAHEAGHLQRGLLAQMICRRERLGAEVVERRDALADAGAVAHLQEMNLAAGAPVVEPSAKA